MKRAFLILAAIVATTGRGQSALPQPGPALQVIPTPALPPPSPALAISPGSMSTNAFGAQTNSAPQALPELLSNLQSVVELTLPSLFAVNDSFDFVTIGNNGIAALVPDTDTNVIGGSSLSSAFSASAPAGGSVVGTLVSNAVAQTTLTRSQVQELLIIQNDLERLLPLLSAVNGFASAATNAVRTP